MESKIATAFDVCPCPALLRCRPSAMFLLTQFLDLQLLHWGIRIHRLWIASFISAGLGSRLRSWWGVGLWTGRRGEWVSFGDNLQVLNPAVLITHWKLTTLRAGVLSIATVTCYTVFDWEVWQWENLEDKVTVSSKNLPWGNYVSTKDKMFNKLPKWKSLTACEALMKFFLIQIKKQSETFSPFKSYSLGSEAYFPILLYFSMVINEGISTNWIIQKH